MHAIINYVVSNLELKTILPLLACVYMFIFVYQFFRTRFSISKTSSSLFALAITGFAYVGFIFVFDLSRFNYVIDGLVFVLSKLLFYSKEFIISLFLVCKTTDIRNVLLFEHFIILFTFMDNNYFYYYFSKEMINYYIYYIKHKLEQFLNQFMFRFINNNINLKNSYKLRNIYCIYNC